MTNDGCTNSCVAHRGRIAIYHAKEMGGKAYIIGGRDKVKNRLSGHFCNGVPFVRSFPC